MAVLGIPAQSYSLNSILDAYVEGIVSYGLLLSVWSFRAYGRRKPPSLVSSSGGLDATMYYSVQLPWGWDDCWGLENTDSLQSKKGWPGWDL